ncbi:PaaI family thioesterase [Sneathiella chungangensis]|uniref:PaaI family thioesterase n=1 Tax=Sneathiella chungangensis TaxID=1418234 RepID=A0A845MG89_9PROT|nr:PaaI family thioesterase [Sneathiella chungangensis]MZR22998.1 PaaI family thioesterase [Sneathiella chungangensis]
MQPDHPEKDEKSAGLARPSDFLPSLPFVKTHGVRLLDDSPGHIVIEAPFQEALSTPPDLFPASVVGTIGDIAAVSSCHSLLPKGWACATLDFTVKMTGQARGEKLIARGRVLQNGRTLSVGAADIYCISEEEEKLCGTVIASTRNFRL